MAVNDFHTQITYAELYKLVIALSIHLESIIGNITIVPVLAKRTVSYVVTILALNKLGIAYSAIDPLYPSNRIRLILSQLNCNFLVVCGFERYEVDEYNDLHIISVNNDYEINYNRISKPLQCKYYHISKDIAVIMFTSGTTGTPKGVLITNCGLINLISNVRSNCEKINRILHHSNISFDAGLFEYWVSILTCTTMILHKDNFNMDSICKSIVESRCNTLLLATSLFHLIVQNNNAVFEGLDYLFTGGEVLSPLHVNKLFKQNRKLILFNGYGPTENTIYSTWHKIQEPVSENIDIPIGIPLSNVAVKIVDNNLDLVGFNELGELLVGGKSLSHSYLDVNETSHKYINIGDKKYFRTGDLVIQNQDRVLFFRGRNDEQLKINGYRVEISEVERCMTMIASIQQAAVVGQHINSLEIRLSAFIIKSANLFDLSEDKIKSELSSVLPSYMIPINIFIIENMPLTPNGKIDKQKLISKYLSKVNSIQPEYIKDELTNVVIGIWRTYLNVDSLILDSDLRSYGASSITITLVQSKLDKFIGINTSTEEVFSLRTLNDWCNYYINIRRSINE